MLSQDKSLNDVHPDTLSDFSWLLPQLNIFKFVLPDKCSNMLRNFFDENGKFSPTKAKLYCLWGSEESDSDQVLLESVLKLLCDKKKEKLKKYDLL